MPRRPFAASLPSRLVLVLAMASGVAQAQAQAPTDVRARADGLAQALVSKMTLDEKLGQLLNTAPAIPRLGVPAYNWWTESLHGALGTVPTTNFPEPIGLAASFDTPLVQEVAGAISTEMRGLHALARQTGRMGRIGTGLNSWSPNINIFRDPRWGRGQETYGEDPFLTARIGVAFITGLQGPNPDLPNVIATPKHFAVHSGPESTRHTANVFVSRHDIEDTYLPAFRAAIVEGRTGSIMCAYNRVDGQPACASDDLLRRYLREAWNFQGYVVSDCDAVTDIDRRHHYAPDGKTAVASAIRAGVDNECNGGTLSDISGLTDRYRDAFADGLIAPAELDRALVRLFSARYRTGDLPGLRPAEPMRPLAETVNTPAHAALALKAAEQSMVLLKNDGILPLRADARIAVIGPLGDATRVLRGNYSSTQSAPPISVVDGLRQAMPKAQVRYVPFGPSVTDGDPVPTTALRTPDGKPGVLARYYNPVEPAPATFAPGTRETALKQMRWAETPVATRREEGIGGGSLDLAQVSDHHRTVWTGSLIAPETGTYRLGLSGMDGTLIFDGKPLAQARGWGSLADLKTVTLRKGQAYPIEVSSHSHGGDATIGLVWKRISQDPAGDLKAAADDADVLVAVVGLTSDLEAEEAPVKVEGFEGGDKTTLDLPSDQRALLEQARATGKPLVVIAMNGSPVNFSWEKEHAAALLEAWYPGQSGGLAVGNILSGKADPGGRLPLTFYRSVADLPPFGDYSMAGRTYRYFTGKPVYPFGHGLSYTSFTYAPLTVDTRGDATKGLRVTTTVRNSGQRAGSDVAQLYLDFPDQPGTPRLALRGFQRFDLAPGQARTIAFDLSPRDLSAVTPDGDRVVLAGQYRVSVGSGQPGEAANVQSGSFEIAKVIALPK